MVRSLGLSRGHHCRFRNQPQGPRRAHAATLAVDQCVGASIATGTVRCVEASCSGPYGSFSTCGSFGRHGYVIATSGVRGWLVDHLWSTRSADWREAFTWQRAVAIFAIATVVAWGIGQLAHAHRASIVTGPRFSLVQPPSTRSATQPSGQRKSRAIFQPSHRRRSVPRSQRAWISPGDYGLDLALQTLRSAFRYLLLILPLISVLFWWQRRHADRMAEAFGKGSPEHEAARRPTVHDWAAGCSIRRARSAAPIPGTSGDRPTGEGLEGLSGGAG